MHLELIHGALSECDMLAGVNFWLTLCCHMILLSMNVMCNAGRAVFCEKPISQEESGIKACYEEAEKANKPLFCSFNRYNHCMFIFELVIVLCSLH